MEELRRIQKNKRDDVWRNVLSKIFNSTYSNFLSNDEIEQRIEYIINNMMKITPINLFKCILYSDTKNEIGKLAIDYRLKFISIEYESCIENGNSFEIENIQFDEKHKLENEIQELCIALNISINSEIANGLEMNVMSSVDFLADVITTKHRKISQPLWNLHEGVQHIMSINQIIYSVIFNQNPFNGEIINEQYRNYIKSHFSTRCLLFESLKNKYHSGIKLMYVQNRDFFG